MVLSTQPREREEMRQYAAEALKGLYTGEPIPSHFAGGRTEALRRLQAFDVTGYDGRHGRVPDGGTSRLSPYIRHGLLTLAEVRDSVMGRFGARASRGFVRQLLWRAYWHLACRDKEVRSSVDRALLAGEDQEAEDRGQGGRHAAEAGPPRLPPLEPRRGRVSTPSPHRPAPYGLYCIDESLRQLQETGFIPYSARLWVASYLLHWQRVHWHDGFRYFQEHLVDADPVVNALSWRWVLGEITGRPYLFTRASIERSTAGAYCARCTASRCPFEGSLESVEERARKPGAVVR